MLALKKEVDELRKENLFLKKAAELFPTEKWEKVSSSIYVAESRTPHNKQEKQKFDKEMNMAKIAQKYGHSIYFVPEKSKGKNADVIMDGKKAELKEITGNIKRVGERFREGMKQANDVYLSINQDFAVKDVYAKIWGEIKNSDYTSGNVYIYFEKSKKMHKWTVEGIIKKERR